MEPAVEKVIQNEGIAKMIFSVNHNPKSLDNTTFKTSYFSFKNSPKKKDGKKSDSFKKGDSFKKSSLDDLINENSNSYYFLKSISKNQNFFDDYLEKINDHGQNFLRESIATMNVSLNHKLFLTNFIGRAD